MKIALHRCRAEIAAPGLPRSCATSLWQTPRYMRPPQSTHLRGPLRQSLNQRNQSVPGFCRFVKGFETIKSGPSLGQSRDSSVPTRSSEATRRTIAAGEPVVKGNQQAIFRIVRSPVLSPPLRQLSAPPPPQDLHKCSTPGGSAPPGVLTRWLDCLPVPATRLPCRVASGLAMPSRY